jgi:hypothetical protein
MTSGPVRTLIGPALVAAATGLARQFADAKGRPTGLDFSSRDRR